LIKMNSKETTLKHMVTKDQAGKVIEIRAWEEKGVIRVEVL